MKKALVATIALGIILVISIIVISRVFYPDNVAETAPGGGAKGLETRFYDSDIASVSQASEDAIGELTTWGGSWRIVDKSNDENSSTIRVEVPVVMFTDDLVIKIQKKDSGSRVDVRSSSRVGKSDFGENARHVRKFLLALDRRVSAPNGSPAAK